MKITLNYKRIIFFIFIGLMIFISLRIDSLSYIANFGIYNKLPYFVIAFFACLLLYDSKWKVRRKNIFYLIALYYLVFLISSSFSELSDFEHAFYTFAPSIAISFMTEFFMRKNAKGYIYALTLALFILLIIDLYTEVRYPNGLYQTDMYSICWFLGYKTSRVRAVTLPLVALISTISIWENKRLDIRFWIVSGGCLLSTFLSDNTSGTVAIFVYIILLLLVYSPKEKIRKYMYKVFNAKVILITIIIMTVAINIFQSIALIEVFITTYLQKTATLGNRFMIWDVAIDLFKNSPIIGKGCVYSQSMSSLVGFVEATQPHSLLLGVMVYTGTVGLVIFMLLIMKSINTIYVKNVNSTSYIWGLFIIVNMFLGITSMMLFSQFLFASMIILAKMSKLDEEKFIK